MNKKFILTVLGYLGSSLALGYSWHMVLFHDKYIAMGAFTRTEPIMEFGMFAMVLQGIVLAYFYPLYYRHSGGGRPTLTGVKYSLFIGLTIYTVMVPATVAKFQIEPILDFVILGTVFQALQFTIFGIIVGLIHGRNP